MKKSLLRRVFPLFLAGILLFGLFPVSTYAEDLPEISITQTDGTESTTGTGEDVSISALEGDAQIVTTPNAEDEDTSEDGQFPQTESSLDGNIISTQEETDDWDALYDSEEGEEPEWPVIGIMALAAAGGEMLELHEFPEYQWDFSRDSGAVQIISWFIETIGGRVAYCVEPTNRNTNAGEYNTTPFNSLSVTQQYAIGYAMLYGASDLSNPLFHMATQVIIWEIVFGYMDLSTFIATNNSAYNSTIGMNPGAVPYYEQITSQMRVHKEVPSFTRFLRTAAPIHRVPGVPGEYKLDLVNTNPNCNLADFAFTNAGGANFTIEGQTLHVSSSVPLSPDMVHAAYKGASGETNSLIYWLSADGFDQVRATADVLDPVPAYFRLSSEDTGEYTIRIEKYEQGTNIPLAGAKFEIRHTEKGMIGTFVTDGSGSLTVTVPWQGTYLCTEVEPPANHLMDENNVKEIVITIDQPNGRLTYFNRAFSGLYLRKLDAVTGEAVSGCVFRIARRGGSESYSEITNAAGVITMSNLEPDWYVITETSTPLGYLLNTEPQNVEIRAGAVASVIFENTPRPGLMVQKVDSVTGRGLAGAAFEVEKISGERIGSYVTDVGGFFFIPNLTEPYAVIRETKAPEGYRLDTAEKLVTLEYGKLNRVVFENSPWPYLAIQKVDENKTPLPGAVFRVGMRDGREIGTYTTNQYGRIVLTGIDAQTVMVREVQAPEGYILDNRDWEVELQWGKTTTITLQNKPLRIGVTVEKRGVVEALGGQQIRYDLRNIANISTVPLDEFYLSDILPTDAARLESIFTGTWNADLTYKVLYRTNLKDNWTVLADNLITSVNHHLVCSSQVLGLASNEYVAAFRFEFGTVPPGFHEEKTPYLFMRVLTALPDGYQFTNRAETGGRYGGKWTYDRDAWVTVIFQTQGRKLPKTDAWL